MDLRKFAIMAATCMMYAWVQVQVQALEKPLYTVIHKESKFEIRLYSESTWIATSPLHFLSFEKATRRGFHRLCQYIEGANLNSSRVAMTAPVLTSITSGAGPFNSSAYVIRLYVPSKFEQSPPVPLPELNLHADPWNSTCIAVSSFSGFAKDENVVKQAESLFMNLQKSKYSKFYDGEQDLGYSIAQYNSPFRIIGRLNEVWAILSDGACLPAYIPKKLKLSSNS